MTSSSPKAEDTIQLNELLAAIWRGKLIVLALAFLGVVAGLVVGAGLNRMRPPPMFEGAVDVSPLGPGEFSAFSSLAQAKVFPYTPITLKDEYLAFLRDPDELTEVAQQTAIVPRNGKTDKEYDRVISDFVNDVSFQKINSGEKDSSTTRVTVRGGNPDALVDFLQRVTTNASKGLSGQLAIEIKNKVRAMHDTQTSAALAIMAKITAAKREANSQRDDLVEKLSEDSVVAKSLGIKRPVILQSLLGASSGAGESPVVTLGTPKNYLQGYEALDEQIRLLEKRVDSSAYAHDLRALERELYLAKNDPQADRVLAILAETPLANPDTSALVRTTARAPNIKQPSARYAMFGGIGLLLGLIFGIAAAAARGIG